MHQIVWRRASIARSLCNTYCESSQKCTHAAAVILLFLQSPATCDMMRSITFYMPYALSCYTAPARSMHWNTYEHLTVEWIELVLIGHNCCLLGSWSRWIVRVQHISSRVGTDTADNTKKSFRTNDAVCVQWTGIGKEVQGVWSWELCKTFGSYQCTNAVAPSSLPRASWEDIQAK